MVCRTTGALLVRQPLPLPDERPAPLPNHQYPIADSHLADLLWAGVTGRTRVIFLSHVTSPTALRLPVAEIALRARAAGILTLVDGAHAPGQIDLDLPALGVDFYTGNLHKWLCAPKGAGFLWARREVQGLIEPLVVSWGWGPERSRFTGSDYVDALEWQGTDDFAAFLSVPAAIAFQREHDWGAVRAACRAKLARTLAEMEAITGMPPAYLAAGKRQGAQGKPMAATRAALLECAALPECGALPPQVGVIPLPPGVDAPALQARLWERHRIEIPAIQWRGRAFLRLSVQGYVTDDDLDRFAAALREEIGE
jgi:isopenicillin-N epimerase